MSGKPLSNEEREVLFRKSSDDFVNEGIAELTRLITENFDGVECDSNYVTVPKDTIEEISVFLKKILLEENKVSLASNTHRFTSAAKELNKYLEDVDEELEIAKNPFPENESRFENDKMTEKSLEENGINPDEFEWASDGRGVFSLSPDYVGNPSKANIDKVEEIIEAFSSFGASIESPPCECCGRTDLPSQEIEYNQGFSLLVTKSTDKPLGASSSLSSGVKGRCPACLLAGWVYTVMRKPVSPIDVMGSEYRVFGFTGGIDVLLDIRRALVEDGMLEDINKLIYTTIPRPNTQSQELEMILVLGRLRESLQKRVEKNELLSGTKLIDLKPTGVFSFYSCPRKSGNPVRNIKSVSSVEVSDSVWDLLGEKQINSTDYYSPTGEIFEKYARMYSGDEEVGIREKNVFGKGVRHSDLRLISNGLFDLFKIISREDTVRVSIKGECSEHYFTTVTNAMAEELSSDELESLKRVGKHIGEVFNTYNDVGTLSSLKNANTPEEFMRKMDTVATDAFKKGHQDATRQFVPDSDEVDAFLNVMLDEEKFDTAKHVFIIHATMAAQYKTMVSRSSASSSSGDGE